jgi:hypothetical protein
MISGIRIINDIWWGDVTDELLCLLEKDGSRLRGDVAASTAQARGRSPDLCGFSFLISAFCFLLSSFCFV